MRISDWSSDVCSSDLRPRAVRSRFVLPAARGSPVHGEKNGKAAWRNGPKKLTFCMHEVLKPRLAAGFIESLGVGNMELALNFLGKLLDAVHAGRSNAGDIHRSEEHTSELKSLMRISYDVF